MNDKENDHKLFCRGFMRTVSALNAVYMPIHSRLGDRVIRDNNNLWEATK